MEIKVRSDAREVENMLKDLEDLGKDIMKPAYKFYKKTTPIRSGNARNNTKLKGTTIKSAYPYAGALDDGFSTQAPDGMTEPTIEQIERLIDKEVNRIGR
jgi:hypothetical protein